MSFVDDMYRASPQGVLTELLSETNKRLGEIRNELRDLNSLLGDSFREYIELRPELKATLAKMQKGIF